VAEERGWQDGRGGLAGFLKGYGGGEMGVQGAARVLCKIFEGAGFAERRLYGIAGVCTTLASVGRG
jgi:hypothetical protein